MARLPIPIHRAAEVFARGFAFTRSFTHPYLAERIGPLWALRDAPRPRGDYRTEEWIAHDVPPAEVDRLARRHTRGRFAICALHGSDEPDAPLRDAYRALGYRLVTTEPLMIHGLVRVPRFDPPVPVERVSTQTRADQLAKAAKARQILPEHLTEDAPLRQYVAVLDERVVGWVRSIAVGDATWCSNMHVLPAYRRRGIARAMLARMLRDAREAGARTAFLLASHAGAKLYPVVGYRQIGTLLLYSPKAKPPARTAD